MHLETFLEALPDTTALVLVGFTFITLALVLKKRLTNRIQPSGNHGPAPEN